MTITTHTTKGTPMSARFFGRSTRFARSVVPVLILASLAACSGSGTSATHPATAGSSAPTGATGAPAGGAGSTAVPALGATASASASGPAASLGTGSAISDAATRLASLTSYRFRIQVEGSGTGGGQAQSGGATMEGTVVFKPTKALKFSITGADHASGGTAGGPDNTMSYVVIGNNVWLDVAGHAMALPQSQTGDAQKAFDEFAPTTLFGDTYVGYLGGMQQVGIESKNGVETIHYQGDDAARAAAAKLYGVDAASWKMDLWVAKDGGYLVSAVYGATVSASGSTGGYQVTMDITNINDPSNVVQPPT